MTALAPLPWIWPLAGGLLIGLAAGTYLLLSGRIAGISGLLAQATGLARGGAQASSIWFVLGLWLGTLAALSWVREITVSVTTSWPLLVVGGLLVGYGTRLGSGCTSGHGVCGLSRASPRSMVATAVFMGTALATVYVVRHVLGALS